MDKEVGEDLSLSEMIDLGQKNGSTTFSEHAREFYNKELHGSPQKSEDGWYFVISRREDHLSTSSGEREYYVKLFTPQYRVKTPHDPNKPFSKESIISFDRMDKAIEVSKSIANGSINKDMWFWY